MNAQTSAVFLGTMNGMPMAYALELRKLGWDVKYFVDVPPTDTLSRPEYKFPEIGFPYPDWIIERPVRSQILAAVSPEFLLQDIIVTLRAADVVFLSGLYLCLSRYLRPEQRVFFLSYGSDLDAWCDKDKVDRLARVFSGRIGLPLAKFLVRKVIGRMITSLKTIDAAITFPPGFLAAADKIINRELAGTDVARISRYDISFSDLPPYVENNRSLPAEPLRVICGTRHTFRDHPGLTEDENKGTDIIIRGLAEYIKNTGRILEINLFEKGLDIVEAKELCRTLGIEKYVTWHKQLPFQDFLALHQKCHVAFDQMGTHLLGLGMYAMYLGMPVIANCRHELMQDFWGEDLPVCLAKNKHDIVEWLVKLESEKVRCEIGSRSHAYAKTHFDCKRTVEKIIHYIEKHPKIND